MIVSHSNASYQGSLVIKGSEIEFRVLDTVFKEVIDKLIDDVADKPKLSDLCNVDTLKMAYRIRSELLDLIQDLVCYRSYDSFNDFLKWEEEFKG